MKYIIGIGNYSMYDDSVGLRIVEYIDANIPERDFEVIDMSDNGLNLFVYLTPETEKIVFVDCISAGGKPGDVITFTPDEVNTKKELAGISTHEGDMLKILALANDMGYVIPPIKFVGIEPESVKLEMSISKTLNDRIPEYTQIAIDELNSKIS
jgi:hydrogenase maturation protease